MSALLVLAAVLQLLIAVLFFVPAQGHAKVIWRILRLPTTPIANLQEGSVEVSGKISAASEPILNLRGQRCVVLETTISNSGKKSTVNSESDSKSSQEQSHKQVASSRLLDASGNVLVELGLCQFIGERWKAKYVAAVSVLEIPWARELLSADAQYIDIEEHFILEGSVVLLNGQAVCAEVDRTGLSYRAATSATQWTLTGTPDALMVMTLGNQTRLLANAMGSLVGVLLVAAYLTALALMGLAYAFES